METQANLPSTPQMEPGVDLGKYLAVLSGQWATIGVFCVSAIATSLALTYIYSEQYQAEITIYFRPNDATLLRNRAAEALGAPLPQAPFKIISQTLNDVIKSEVVTRPVVRELHLDQEITKEYDTWYQRWYYDAKKKIKDWGKDAWELLKYGRLIEESKTLSAERNLSENLSIVSNKDSYIYALAVKDQSAERAAKIVDAVGAQLVKWSQQQDATKAESRGERLATEIDAKEGEIAALRRTRDDILRKANITSIPAEEKTGVESVYDLKRQLESSSATLQEKKKRLDEIQQMIASRNTRYIEPEHLKNLEQEKLVTEIDIQSIAARRASLQASIDRMQARLEFVLSIKKQIEDIETKIERASRANMHIGDMKLEASEEQVREAEVKVLHAATVPEKPISPIKIYHVGLTAILSIFFAIGMTFVLIYFDLRGILSPPRRPRDDASAAVAEAGRG